MKEKGMDVSKLDVFPPLVGIVQNTLEEVRRIIMDLRPSTLDDIGILATISWFCREFENLYQDIRIERHIEVKEEEIPVSIKTVIFRVLQEALNNVSKHSRASRVKLRLRKNESRLELVLEDNGRGFNYKKAASLVSLERGFGLASMRERVELAGGSFDLKAREGGGTRIRAAWDSGITPAIG
jgi:signal transduction histidine kinase